jgi:zinc D-Ala-D-Ala carboxypeptidase
MNAPTNLSPHFTLEELTTSTKQKALNIDNTPSPEILSNLKTLVIALEMIRSVIAKPIKISSAYRCPALNKAVGGSNTSAHVLGLAVDFTVDGMTPRQICEKLLAAGIPHDQIICEDVSPTNPDGRWVHFGLSKGTMRNQVLTMKAGKYYTGLIK